MEKKVICPVCERPHRPDFVFGNSMGMGKECARKYKSYRLARRWEIDKRFKVLNDKGAA